MTETQSSVKAGKRNEHLNLKRLARAELEAARGFNASMGTTFTRSDRDLLNRSKRLLRQQLGDTRS
eukprot:CAMPEP_0113935942 /NCGR_PEP_ID=MMETSP1339-20121228/2964_1 /TAXON_ID=94617 /ORGANISM="Fibrocapsa japonica" /LENGTH=65 /DNA_ID=CAMNT_0000938247 /DNA_START=149 /DNA_END=342 /DNA_ORIENTATION=- /assembly_acc=CAM_ASM_000762